MVKRSIEQDLRNKNFGARNGNYERNAKVKNQGTKQRVQRTLGDCWQWKTNGKRETMERLNSGESKTIFRNISCIVIIGLTKSGRAAWLEEEYKRKDFSSVLILQEQFCTSELFKVIQDAISLILLYRDNVVIPSNFFQYIYHVGCAINRHSIINPELILGGQNLNNRQTVFFLPVDPMDKEHKDPDTIDLEAPCLAQNMHKTLKTHQNMVYWVDINRALKIGLKFYQTRSNAIILHETLPCYSIPKVVRMENDKSYTR